MKLKGTPLILLLVAIGLASVVYLIESRQPTPQALNQDAAQPLFKFQEEDVEAFTLATPQQTLVLRKVENSTHWQMIAPQPGPAEEGTIAFLLNLMATSKSQQTFQIPKSRQSEFGFAQPLATIKATLANQQVVTLVLGQPTFDRSALYALIDPTTSPNQELTVHLVSTNFANAINRPFTEWQKPPSPKKK
jgi:hypothetical protein